MTHPGIAAGAQRPASPAMQRADLHIHTRASDGELPPGEVVRIAAAARLDVIAITDHDTIGGLAEALAAADGGPVRVIPGVEISSRHGEHEIHVLGYHVRPDADSILAHEHGALGRRAERAMEMVRRLRDQGVDIDYEDVLHAAGKDARAIGRPHVARALLARGQVRSFGEAFERYLADGGLAYVSTHLPSVEEAIGMIRGAGGVAVWAHPDPAIFDRDVATFAGWGMSGIECFRPNTPPDVAKRYHRAARDLGMFATGGSDWHGPHRNRLGDFFVPLDQVRELLDAGPPG